MNTIKHAIILCILSVSVPRLQAQNIKSCEEIPDSINRNPTFSYGELSFNAKQLILPTSLFTIGALGTFIKPYEDFNVSIRDKVTELKGNHKFKADDYAQYLPTATHLFLGFANVPHKNTFLQRLSIDATSAISLTILTNVFKLSFREKRPDSNARNSFPSGHTATAFMGAELLRIEYGKYWGVGGYCVATVVGLLRIYNGRHWVSDVIAGAGIGILSARIGYWMLPLYNKWFFKSAQTVEKGRNTLSFSALPSYDHYTNALTLNCIIEF